jgi:hypothetical protein
LRARIRNPRSLEELGDEILRAHPASFMYA